MTDEEMRVNLAELERYEDRVPWLYLDSADSPNVTVGVGCLIATVDEAKALPFHHFDDGLRASPSEIAVDFLRVRSMRGGLRARSYAGRLRMSDQDIDALAFKRMRVFLADLPAVFPGFDEYPISIRQCLLDLAWNNGLGAEATVTRPASGLRAWKRLRAACAAHNWAVGAQECVTANFQRLKVREARNAWRTSCFIRAARDIP